MRPIPGFDPWVEQAFRPAFKGWYRTALAAEVPQDNFDGGNKAANLVASAQQFTYTIRDGEAR